MKSELCVPIKSGEELLGVINAESRHLNYFSEADERLFVAIAGSLTTAMLKLRLFEAERTRRQEAEILRQAAAAVSSSLELRKVLDTILISLKKVIPYDSASIMLLEGDRLRLMAVQGFPNPEEVISMTFPVKDQLLNQTKRMKKPLILDDASIDPRFHKWAGTDYTRGWMGAPLIVRDNVIGYITINNKQPSVYNEESAAVVTAFAFQYLGFLTRTLDSSFCVLSG
jgi:GAF domain-containing protein